MFNIFIIVHITLDRAIRRHSFSQQYRIHDCLPVNSIIYRRNNVFILLPVLICKIIKNPPVIGSLHIITGVPFLICKFLCILWSQKCQIQITRLHLHCFGIIICHDLEYDLVNVRCTFKIVLIFYQRNRLSFVPAV